MGPTSVEKRVSQLAGTPFACLALLTLLALATALQHAAVPGESLHTIDASADGTLKSETGLERSVERELLLRGGVVGNDTMGMTVRDADRGDPTHARNLKQALPMTINEHLARLNSLSQTGVDMSQDKRSRLFKQGSEPDVYGVPRQRKSASDLDAFLGRHEIPHDLDSMTQHIVDARKNETFLFIGILSGMKTIARRLAVRSSWMRYSRSSATVSVKVVLSHLEAKRDEILTGFKNDDTIIVSGQVTYTSILSKVFAIMQHGESLGAKFVLKTDDDSYVNVPALVQSLATECVSEGCKTERLYMGRIMIEAEVYERPYHKWFNGAYLTHAAVSTYMPYMLGGGYVLSQDIVHALVHLQHTVGLKSTPIEDATIGMWLAGMDVRYLDWSQVFITEGYPCCFERDLSQARNKKPLGRFAMGRDPCQMVDPGPWRSPEEIARAQAVIRAEAASLQASNTQDTVDTDVDENAAPRHLNGRPPITEHLNVAGSNEADSSPPPATPYVSDLKQVRSFVLHKVSTVTQMLFLHWRLQNCDIDHQDLFNTTNADAASDYIAFASTSGVSMGVRPVMNLV